jgi:hypothetical protein
LYSAKVKPTIDAVESWMSGGGNGSAILASLNGLRPILRYQ